MDQTTLKKFIKRRHPLYESMLPHWQFLAASYEGGRAWFKGNIFQYVKEGTQEFRERLERAYRFNHSREVVDLINKYIFKIDVKRSDDAPDSVKTFWKDATLNGLPIKEYMREVSKLTSIYGRVWVVVDNNGDTGPTVSDEKNFRVYSYCVTPEDLLDLSVDESGALRWVLIHEQVRDDEDPLTSSGGMVDRFRLWERNQWTLFTVRRNSGSSTPFNYVTPEAAAATISGGKVGEIGSVETGRSDNGTITIEVEGPVAHDLGVVPVIAANNAVSNDPYVSQGVIEDVAYLDRAVTNYLSNLDAVIQDQTFSQLVIPAQGMDAGDKAHRKLLAMGTKRIFTYDAEGGGKPEFISPDVKQAELILKVINKIINEIYHTVGLAGERTKEDNSVGIDNSSGVAKAYDFERVNALLASKADALEDVENKIVNLVRRWHGETPDDADRSVLYPDNFDVRGLYDEFEISARLSLVEAPDLVRRTQMEVLIDKVFPMLKKELKDKMLSELKDWPVKPDPIETAVAPAAPGEENALQKAGTDSLANKLVKEGGK